MLNYIKDIKHFKVAQFWNPELKKTQYCLLEDYEFWYNNNLYKIEAGYVTDWASVPQWLWSVFHPMGLHDGSDLEHDYLYDNRITTREKVDEFFYVRMRECGLSKTNAWCRWAGVRIGGKNKWIN